MKSGYGYFNNECISYNIHLLITCLYIVPLYDNLKKKLVSNSGKFADKFCRVLDCKQLLTASSSSCPLVKGLSAFANDPFALWGSSPGEP